MLVKYFFNLPSKFSSVSVIWNALLALNMLEQVAWNKLKLLPNNILQNTQTLQLCTMIIIMESIY
jgi:hypothetical protein